MLTENKDKKISIRISENDYRYLAVVAFMAGMNVSKYVRTLLDASINAMKIGEAKGQVKLEDFKDILDHKL